MNKPSIYMDNAATSQMLPEVTEAMQPYLGAIYGNPSSLHTAGKQAAKAMAQARAQIAQYLNVASSEEIIFTHGGTESNNMVFKGITEALINKGRHVITSVIEHPAVLEPCAWLEQKGWQVTYLPVNAEGFVSPNTLSEAIRPDTVLISVMHGNNEMGALQPIEALGALARERGILFHTDAVQTVGKLPLNLQNMPVDLLSCSAHKLHGPKGVGFLYASANAHEHLRPLLHGGGQEGGYRSGTENLAGIVGMAKALKLAIEGIPGHTQAIQAMQKRLIQGIMDIAPQARLNGPLDENLRVPGNLNFSFAPVEGEALVLRFDLEGICVSSGSACHSGQLNGSHVLNAMGCTDDEAKSTVRFSLSHTNTLAEVEAVLAALPRVLQRAGYFRSHPATATIQ